MNWIPLLLADPSPCLRLLVLKELLQKPESDPEIQELLKIRDSDPLVADFIKLQQSDGSWKGVDFPNLYTYTDKITTTSMVLLRFGFLGFSSDYPAVRKGIDFLFSKQLADGSWPLINENQKTEGNYDMIPLQTAFPLRAVSICGESTDERAELGFKWLADKRLKDGSWPTGEKAGTRGFVAGYRKLAHSRWGCRTNTTAVLHCFSLHPKRKKSDEALRALDLLLARETREKHTLGFEVARIIGLEIISGFFTHFARFDVAFLLHLCWRIGANTDDERVSGLLKFILGEQGQYGLWYYSSFPQASRWITFDILRSINELDKSSDWLSYEPRTSFQGYTKIKKRF